MVFKRIDAMTGEERCGLLTGDYRLRMSETEVSNST